MQKPGINRRRRYNIIRAMVVTARTDETDRDEDDEGEASAAAV